jgi:hypothetical protein
LGISGSARIRGTLVRIAAVPAHALVVVYLLLDDLIFPLFRPFARWLAGRTLVLSLQRWIASLPRYVILLILILPFAIAEPAKIFALYLIGCDHVWIGLAVLVLAYLISIVVVERIFDAGRSKLMRIRWFAKLWSWFTAIRSRLTDWVQATRAWKELTAFRVRIRRMFNGVSRSARAARARSAPTPQRGVRGKKA